MATNYDKIATEYHKVKVNPIKRYSEEYTFFKILGDVKGKSVLDLACGDGYYTRAMRREGAQPIIGADISVNMIRLAEAIEAKKPMDIRYQVGDASLLGHMGEFDLVTAVYLFQYAAHLATLERMIRTAYENTKANGRFVTITGNPDITPEHLTAQKDYGVIIEMNGPLEDGTSIHNTIVTPRGPVEFDNYHWTKPTYERLLNEVGFQKIVWHEMRVAEEAISALPKSYWDAYLKYPSIVLLECYK